VEEECRIEHGGEEGQELSTAWEGGPTVGVERGGREGMGGENRRTESTSNRTPQFQNCSAYFF
jgi:hypothetical protein